MSDRGGWRSKGSEVRCPKCGEWGMQIETTLYGKTKAVHFCKTCAHDWPRDPLYDISGNAITGP